MEEAAPVHTPEPFASPGKLSIAALPFEVLSANPEQKYFSGGMAEDLMTDLSKFSNLDVAARYSSFSFKDQMRAVWEAAEKLGVSHILEGKASNPAPPKRSASTRSICKRITWLPSHPVD